MVSFKTSPRIVSWQIWFKQSFLAHHHKRALRAYVIITGAVISVVLSVGVFNEVARNDMSLVYLLGVVSLKAHTG